MDLLIHELESMEGSNERIFETERLYKDFF